MLFNLSQQRHFPHTQQAEDAIFCGSICGPWFTGGSEVELSACFEPFNGDNNCLSFANHIGYKIPL
jgi:hypothetical protein